MFTVQFNDFHRDSIFAFSDFIEIDLLGATSPYIPMHFFFENPFFFHLAVIIRNQHKYFMRKSTYPHAFQSVVLTHKGAIDIPTHTAYILINIIYWTYNDNNLCASAVCVCTLHSTIGGQSRVCVSSNESKAIIVFVKTISIYQSSE